MICIGCAQFLCVDFLVRVLRFLVYLKSGSTLTTITLQLPTLSSLHSRRGPSQLIKLIFSNPNWIKLSIQAFRSVSRPFQASRHLKVSIKESSCSPTSILLPYHYNYHSLQHPSFNFIIHYTSYTCKQLASNQTSTSPTIKHSYLPPVDSSSEVDLEYIYLIISASPSFSHSSNLVIFIILSTYIIFITLQYGAS